MMQLVVSRAVAGIGGGGIPPYVELSYDLFLY